MRRSLASLVLAGLTTSFAVEAADPEIPSAWRRGDVVVDGRSDDWSGRLVPVAGTPILAAVQNDGSFLYLCLRASDESTKRVILGTGLSIYLDASGKHDRAFGVRFPVGRFSAAPGVREPGGAPRRQPEGSSYADDLKAVRGLELAAAGVELEILKKEKGDRGRMSLPEALPLKAALGEEEDGALVIELSVPLAFSLESPHAIETRPGQTIALGLETQPLKAERGSGFSFGGPGGGRGPGGPGGGRGPGGAPMDQGPSGPKAKLGKALKVWATVPLAPLAPLAEPATPPQEAAPKSPSM